MLYTKKQIFDYKFKVDVISHNAVAISWVSLGDNIELVQWRNVNVCSSVTRVTGFRDARLGFNVDWDSDISSLLRRSGWLRGLILQFDLKSREWNAVPRGWSGNGVSCVTYLATMLWMWGNIPPLLLYAFAPSRLITHGVYWQGCVSVCYCLTTLSVTNLYCWWRTSETWVWSNGVMVLTGNPTYREKNLSHCHVKWPEIEARRLRWEAGNCLTIWAITQSCVMKPLVANITESSSFGEGKLSLR